MHFPGIHRPKFEKSSLWYLPWDHPAEPLNQANSKETKSLRENGCRQKCLDKILHITGKYRGSAYRDCNITVKLNHKIPVVLHNLKNYDSHLIL